MLETGEADEFLKPIEFHKDWWSKMVAGFSLLPILFSIPKKVKGMTQEAVV